MKHAMRDLVCVLLLLCVIAICPRSWAQAPASLVVTTDMDCNWKLDGAEQPRLSVDNAKVLQTIVGEHLIEATSLDGQAKWQGTVAADSTAQKVVKIPLSNMLPFWTDPATGLTWAKKDNGSDATWNQANEYCQNLKLAGRSGWRLPAIDELWGIFDQAQAGQRGLHAKGRIRVSWPGVWSSTQGNTPEEKWAFSFYNGSRGSSEIGPGHINRALCVRSSGGSSGE
ncbi:MAG: DUF1566 domain-containing protein [Candidatus Sulfotelmatobacter sp.]